MDNKKIMRKSIMFQISRIKKENIDDKKFYK
jgi:hypothetical protein